MTSLKRKLFCFKKTFLLALFFIFSINVFSEIVLDETYNWSLDFPEDFEMQSENLSYAFTHKTIPVTIAIRLYEKDTFKNEQDAFYEVAKKISANVIDEQRFTWRNTNCTLAQASFEIEKKSFQSWIASLIIPQTQCAIVLLGYSESEKFKSYENIILSILNSLAIDQGSYRDAGLIATFAYPRENKKNISLTIANKKIKTTIDEIDSEANNFVINMEFAVLKLYQKSSAWQEVWERYYRAIFRDSFARVKKVSFDVRAALSRDVKKINAKNENAAFAELILKWVQDFSYGRQMNAADFTSPIDAMLASPCDCDTRSLLSCVILENAGIESALFVSREKSHALFGVNVLPLAENQNAHFTLGEKNFVLGETTAHVDFGLIADEMKDARLWMPVLFQ